MKKLFIMLICGFCLVGCSSGEKTADGVIDYVEAKEQIINNSAVLMDVRTEEEYNTKHIEGAVLLPLDEINEESLSEKVDSKDTPIILYCRSGNRSHQALEILKNLGYEKVYDLGAMANWQE